MKQYNAIVLTIMLGIGTVWTGILYINAEREVTQDNATYEWTQSYTGCLASEHLSNEECEAIHGTTS